MAAAGKERKEGKEEKCGNVPAVNEKMGDIEAAGNIYPIETEREDDEGCGEKCTTKSIVRQRFHYRLSSKVAYRKQAELVQRVVKHKHCRPPEQTILKDNRENGEAGNEVSGQAE